MSALRTRNSLLASVGAPLCKIENKNQDENNCQRGSNGRHKDNLLIDSAVLGPLENSRPTQKVWLSTIEPF
jgi:hypothetical protein